MTPSVAPPNTHPAAGESPPPSPPPARRGRPQLMASVALAAVLAGFAFAVFGGAGNRVIDPVAQAATVSSNTPGYRVRFSMQVTSSATARPITATGYGAFAPRDHSGSLSMTMNLGNDPQVIQSLGSDTVTMEEVLKGTTVYVKLPATAVNTLPFAGKQWIAVDLGKLTGVPGLSSLASSPVASDPSQMLQYLRAVSDSIVAVGHQRVDGMETTHYRADLNLGRVAGALPAADQAAARQALSALERATQITHFPVDVWVDAHHLVRRIEMTIAWTLSGGPTTNELMTMDISHYGPQPAPALPPAAEVANLSAILGSGG